MKRVIVTTTINAPTEAIRRFDSMKDWHLIVVGDLKTPADYHLERGTYFSPSQQEKYDPQLSDALGWNSIQRRNLGFLMARELGAEIIATIDDDNIPKEDWGKDLLLGREAETWEYETDLPCFEPIGATNESKLWHRGYPLQLLSSRDYSRKRRTLAQASIQADFWDGDPDVDAVCRMEHAPDCTFDPGCFPFVANQVSPFNSQNTFLLSSVLRDYFVFPFVGRMDDIWAGYYVQARGHRVIYGSASVVQKRNPHDLIEDMRQEYLGYEKNLHLIRALAQDPERIFDFLPERAATAFRLYQRYWK